MILTNNSTRPIGLDISDLSLKVVQLEKTREKIKIQALGRLNLEPGIIENGEIKNKAELIKAVKRITSEPMYGKINSEEAVVCLPESKTFIKLIEIQKSPNDLKEIISHEIEKHVPMSLNEIYFDWQIIENRPDESSVLIGAAPKNIVDQYTDMLDQAKLYPVALEIEPVSICRCLLREEISSQPKMNSGANYGIIDIGEKHTCMTFYSANTILFTTSMPISGEKITLEITQKLDISNPQAEKAKIICGMDEKRASGVIKKILADTVGNLTKKITEAVNFYDNNFGQRERLNKILLCGGGANIPNLAETISEKISIKTEMADIFYNLPGSESKIEEIFAGKSANNGVKQNPAAGFATAIGLALRGIFIEEEL